MRLPGVSGAGFFGRLSIATLTDADASDSTEQRQITVSPIERFAIAPIEARGIVPGFGGVTPAQIEAGVRVLAEVLEQQARG